MDKPNRGRSRGRTRLDAGAPQPGAATPSAQGGPRPGGAWGSGNPMRGGIPSQPQSFTPAPSPQGAWGAKQPQQPPPPRQAAPLPAAAGRTQYRGGDGDGPTRGGAAATTAEKTHAGSTAEPGNGADAEHSGRGAHRGRRYIPEVSTRLASEGKQGTSGDVVNLQTNYFRVEKRTDWCIFQYRVDFDPEMDVTKDKKRLFYTATHSLGLKGLFDGTVMFTPHRITPDPREFVVDSIGDTDEKVRITVRMVGEVDRSDYQYIQVFNLILRKCMQHLKLQLVGRDYFDPAAKVVVNRLNMELWPGVVTSMRQHESDLLFCCEIKYKVMKNDTALDLMRATMDDRDRRAVGDWKTRFLDKILNTIVITEHNNRTYHIDDVDFNSNPSSTFEIADKSRVVYADYYKKKYGITINNMTQPLLISKAKARDLRAGGAEVLMLIPELCRLTGLTQAERDNRGMMSEIAEYMRPTPERRVANLRKFNSRVQGTPECTEELKMWDLALSKDIISLSGRQLPVEVLRYANGDYSATREADWTKEMRSKPMFRNAEIGNWAIICGSRDKAEVHNFYTNLEKAANGMRWPLSRPIVKELGGFDQQAYNRAIEEVCQQNPQIRMFLIAVPKTGDYYNFIKKKLTVEKGILSQLITRSAFAHKSVLSIATKVAIQMNCKLGGAPWAIRVPFDCMFCGFDVCHDPKNKSKSFGAFVASYDKDATAYYSSVSAHKDGEELSNFVGLTMVKALKEALKKRGKYPDKIMFYRDGVGDGQIGYVMEHEIKKVKEAIESAYKEQNQKLAAFRFIIVNKRINTRFFLQGRNPGPGTVVDDVVTMPDRSDFYLIPQCTRQGTVSPTYYNIMGPDEFGLNTDRTQVMTYRLCHSYYNWSGTVRVPAPCQYAHKLAFLAAQSLQRTPKECLNHLLHFL